MKRTTNPDADLLATIKQHDLLWARWGHLLMEDDALDTDDLCARCGELELRAIITPAHTRRGLVGKRRIIRRAEFEDSDGIVAAILQADAERIAAATC